MEAIERQEQKYMIKLKMFVDTQEQVFDFTPLIELVQFNGIELIVKIMRQVHHNYALLNIEEMTNALNSHKTTLGSYSESIPAELYFLKEFADRIEDIKPLKNQMQ